MSLLIALGGAARRGSEMLQEARDAERKKQELEELRAYQREVIQDQREYQKGLTKEEREYQDRLRGEEREYQSTVRAEERSFTLQLNAQRLAEAKAKSDEAFKRELQLQGYGDVDINDPAALSEAIKKKAQQQSEAEIEAFRQKQQIEFDFERKLKELEEDNIYLPKEQVGFMQIQSHAGDSKTDRSQLFYNEFLGTDWRALSNQYEMSNSEQKRTALEIIKKRAKAANTFYINNQRDDKGNLVKKYKNLVQVIEDSITDTPFEHIIRAAVLDLPVEYDEDGRLKLPGGQTTSADPNANTPAKAVDMDLEEFILDTITNAPELTMTTVGGNVKIPNRYFNAMDSILKIGKIAEAVTDERETIESAIDDLSPAQKKQIAYILNVASKNPESPEEAIAILRAIDKKYAFKPDRPLDEYMGEYATQLFTGDVLAKALKDANGDYFTAARKVAGNEEALLKDLKNFKGSFKNSNVGSFRDGAMLIRGIQGQFNRAFSTEEDAAEYLEKEREKIVKDYLKDFDPTESEMTKQEYEKEIRKNLVLDTKLADMNEERRQDAIYRLLRERLAYKLAKTADDTGRISDTDRESGLIQLGTAGYQASPQGAEAAVDYLIADSQERLNRVLPFTRVARGPGVSIDYDNIRDVKATLMYYDYFKENDMGDYRQQFDPEKHNVFTTQEGRMFMTDAEGSILFEDAGGIELVKNPKTGIIVRKDSVQGYYSPDQKPSAPPPSPPSDSSMYDTGISPKNFGLDGNKLMISRDTNEFMVDGRVVTDEIPLEERLKIIRAL